MRTLILLAVLFLAGCDKKGDVLVEPTDIFKLHGKTYRATKIVVTDGGSAIWIVYPKDSGDLEVINTSYHEHKHDQSVAILP